MTAHSPEATQAARRLEDRFPALALDSRTQIEALVLLLDAMATRLVAIEEQLEALYVNGGRA